MLGMTMQRAFAAATLLIALSACAIGESHDQVAAKLAPDVVGTARAAILMELEGIAADSNDRRLMLTAAPGGREIVELLQAVRDPDHGETKICREILTIERGVVSGYERSGPNC